MNDSGIASRIGRGTGGSERVRLLADGHVHLHPGHDGETLIEGAIGRLQGLGAGLPTLFLTEVAGISMFDTWRDGLAVDGVRPTGEMESIVVKDRMLVLAGIQVVTRERIEVLALATRTRIDNGLTLEETLDRVEQAGAIPVLPWGLGKWLGVRGRQVAAAASARQLLLGDNAGRPGFWPEPKVFRNYPVLPGTDPLRVPGEERLVGAYGFMLDCEIELDRPADSIRRALRQLKPGSPPRFGKRVPFPYSITRQFAHKIPGGKSGGRRPDLADETSPLAGHDASNA